MNLTKISTEKQVNLNKLNKKVFFNRDILKNILSYSGPLYKEICQTCNKPLCYNIFLVNIDMNMIKFYNLEQCRIKTFCSEECLEEYNVTYSNSKCIASILIVFLSFVLAFFTIIFFANA